MRHPLMMEVARAKSTSTLAQVRALQWLEVTLAPLSVCTVQCVHVRGEGKVNVYVALLSMGRQ